MRKRLLRSRSGFEKPESREEAIMQNILGASNVLEPSESNIEEILKSILYNTPYTKEAEFEIEKILLAIKNNGTYDGECESRDMKILFAILKDLDYTEEAESRIEELFIEWLHQRSSIKVLEGVPPLTFTSRGLPLINYLIEGNTVQNGTPTPQNPIQPSECGDRTGNLFDGQLQQGYYTYNNGVYVLSDAYVCTHLIPCTENTTYTFRCINTGGGSKNYGYVFFDSSQNRIGDDYINAFTEGDVVTHTATTPQNTAFLAINIAYGSRQAHVVRPSDITNFMLNLGSTALPYEPYGVKIPISSGGVTTNIYLGSTQTARRIGKLVLTGEENWNIWPSGQPDVERYYYEWGKTTPSDYSLICTHLPLIKGDGNYEHVRLGGITRGDFITFISKTIAPTVADFKAYLAAQYANGTPVTVWYTSVSETTGIVNEPLRKIGDYADTLSMEQAGVEIPTASGSNTLDVDTTVKPSNIYIEYK